jgi:hypothetical protein
VCTGGVRHPLWASVSLSVVKGLAFCLLLWFSQAMKLSFGKMSERAR